MNSRERMIKAIEFGSPDRMPIITWRAEKFDGWLRFKGHERYRPEIESFLKKYPDDAYYVDTPWIMQGRSGEVGSEISDEWGIVWKTLGVGCMDIKHPLADWEDFENYQFPAPSFYVPPEAKEAVGCERPEKYTYTGTFGGYFQLMGSLRGFENLMMDLARQPEKLSVLADKLLDYFLRLIEKWSEIGVDGMFFGDDWGTQERLIIHPDMWREFFKPRYKKMFDAVHNDGAHVWFHSDGYVMDIIPDLIEIGVDVLNVNQLCLNGLDKIKEKYSGKVCFLGGLDQQNILPFGSTEDVEEHVKHVSKALGTDKGGYIAVPLSGGGYDVPFANLEVALNTFAKYSKTF